MVGKLMGPRYSPKAIEKIIEYSTLTLSDSSCPKY